MSAISGGSAASITELQSLFQGLRGVILETGIRQLTSYDN